MTTRILRYLAMMCMLTAAQAGCKPEPAVKIPCALPEDSPDRQPVETLCDGLDNDCDGLTDKLPVHEVNRCEGEGCRGGYAACVGGERKCLDLPAVQETVDGVDNDCDGETDEPSSDAPTLPGRALIVVPPYIWEQYAVPAHQARAVFEWIGLPFDFSVPLKDQPEAPWEAGLKDLASYRLVYMPGYLLPSALTTSQLKALSDWVNDGGVLVWTKPLGPQHNQDVTQASQWQQVAAMSGFASQSDTKETTRVRVTGQTPASLWLDMAEEREIFVASESTESKPSAEVFTYAPLKDASVFATAYGASKSLGATWLRHPMGEGVVYTLGFDPASYTRAPCYVNCYDPAIDVAAQLLKAAWREASGGHYVVKHTVPGVESGVLVVSHDVDAPDSHHSGVWGDPGAVQMAEMQKVEGVKGTYFITTDYVNAYYNPAMVKRLCQLKMCPAGGHSIQHLWWGKFPKGQCPTSKLAYATSSPTVCGEVGVNIELLKAATPSGTRLDSWRTPYLDINPQQYHVLASYGVRYDSSLAVGDLRTNYPVFLPHYPLYDIEDTSDLEEMWVFPVSIEDGIGSEEGVEEGGNNYGRKELSKPTWPEFRARWARIMAGNAGNNAWSMLLVHPSYGVGPGIGPDNVETKIDAVKWAIREGKRLGLHVDMLGPLGDFWRARHTSRLTDLSYANGVYKGRVVVGPRPYRRLSLEFGDHIVSVQHNTSSEVEIRDNRISFKQIMPANSVIEFTAKVGVKKQ